RPPPLSPLFPYTTLFRSLDIPTLFHQLGALPNQGMAAAGKWGVDRSGDGEDLAAAFQCQPCGEQGAALGGRLHHQYAPRERRHRSEEHTSELQSRENLVC